MSGTQRDLEALSNRSFDLLMIGGGIHGACVAWEATLRGLSVDTSAPSADADAPHFVQQQGIRYAQGYRLGRPYPL